VPGDLLCARFANVTEPFKLVAVALANKMARIAFAIMRGKTSYSAAPA
jgi:transposase